MFLAWLCFAWLGFACLLGLIVVVCGGREGGLAADDLASLRACAARSAPTASP